MALPFTGAGSGTATRTSAGRFSFLQLPVPSATATAPATTTAPATALAHAKHFEFQEAHAVSPALSSSHFQFTPPATPRVAAFDMADADGGYLEQDTFHAFLRAFCPYHPQAGLARADGGESSVTVPIAAGDVILVHSVQPNGWADGTLLASGVRGWLPTNYCDAYDPDAMRNLLDALTHVFEFIRGHDDGGEPSVFVGQDYVRGMIAGVRVLLEQTDCLTRESPLVAGSVVCRRARRGILGELSTFVKAAKALQAICQDASAAPDAMYDALDDIVLRAYKVVTRAVKFLDAWTSLRQRDIDLELDYSPPLTPAYDVYEHATAYDSHAPQSDALVSSTADPAPRPVSASASALAPRPATATARSQSYAGDYNEHSLDRHHNNAATPTPQAYTSFAAAPVAVAPHAGAAAGPAWRGPALSTTHPASMSTTTTTASLSSTTTTGTTTRANTSAAASTQSSSARTSIGPPRRSSASHRLSSSSRAPGAARSQDMASERLSAAHDALLGSLGNLTGLHTHARSSFELLARTQQTLAARQGLMAVVEDVWQRDGCRSKSLDDSKDVLDGRLVALVQITTRLPSLDDADAAGPVPDHEQSIMETVMLCVRAAGDCVAKARTVIQRIGDFDMATASGPAADSLGLVHAPAETDASADMVAYAAANRYSLLYKPLPSAPAGLQRSSSSRPSTAASTLASTLSYGLPEVPPAPTRPMPRPSANCLAEPIELLPRHSSDTVVRPKSVTGAWESSRFPSLDLDIPPTSPIVFPDHSAPAAEPAEATATSTPATRNASSSMGSFSVADTTSSYVGSARFSAKSSSSSSTLATTPDESPSHLRRFSDELQASFDSLPGSARADELDNTETALLTTTYAHELTFNKDGMLTGGSLPALVERLTAHDTTPDALFVNTFYLTFRLFCKPRELAQCLVDRFHYIGANPALAMPVRLRVFNVLKSWLENHWRHDTDAEALGTMSVLAAGALTTNNPTAGRKLLDSIAAVERNAALGLAGRVTLQGKANAVIGSSADLSVPVPNPVLSKSQLSLLKRVEAKSATCTILDFAALEIARQLTLIESRIFCRIASDELLDSEWVKKQGSKAVNVKAMSSLSTGLTSLVADSILAHEDAGKRSKIVKRWIKIATHCRDLYNYDSLMAIVCSLNSSMIGRLKKTWDLVPDKTVRQLDELRAVTDCGRNFATLRGLLQGHVAPCLPFVGTYLTDLTFVDVGNQTRRSISKAARSSGTAATIDAAADVPTVNPRDCVSVINFDKQTRTAKIIGDLQRFQVPYRLAPVPELHDWLDAQIRYMQTGDHASVAAFYRRSCALEPKQQQAHPQLPAPQLLPAAAVSNSKATAAELAAGASFSSISSLGSAGSASSALKETAAASTSRRFDLQLWASRLPHRGA